MIFKTKGIVLKSFAYSESSIIVKILTKEFGVKSYILKGSRKPKSKLRSNIFQPLYILDLEAYNNPKKDLQIISEAKIDYDLTTLFSDIKKTTIGFFISDIINQCLREEEKNEELYCFIEKKIIALNSLENNYSTFHLYFLTELSEHLGFRPLNNYSPENQYFDLRKGYFIRSNPIHNNHLNEKDSALFSTFLFCENPIAENNRPITLTKEEKTKILTILINFYETHLLSPNSIKSHEILTTILH
ncbi:MAG: DNA repair protein RecO [Bacteroidales bacterium]|nr:DNA repair protein RecO [Bacteroidales bacterium]